MSRIPSITNVQGQGPRPRIIPQTATVPQQDVGVVGRGLGQVGAMLQQRGQAMRHAQRERQITELSVDTARARFEAEQAAMESKDPAEMESVYIERMQAFRQDRIESIEDNVVRDKMQQDFERASLKGEIAVRRSQATRTANANADAINNYLDVQRQQWIESPKQREAIESDVRDRINAMTGVTRGLESSDAAQMTFRQWKENAQGELSDEARAGLIRSMNEAVDTRAAAVGDQGEAIDRGFRQQLDAAVDSGHIASDTAERMFQSYNDAAEAAGERFAAGQADSLMQTARERVNDMFTSDSLMIGGDALVEQVDNIAQEIADSKGGKMKGVFVDGRSATKDDIKNMLVRPQIRAAVAEGDKQAFDMAAKMLPSSAENRELVAEARASINRTLASQRRTTEAADQYMHAARTGDFNRVFPNDNASKNKAANQMLESGMSTPQVADVFAQAGQPVPPDLAKRIDNLFDPSSPEFNLIDGTLALQSIEQHQSGAGMRLASNMPNAIMATTAIGATKGLGHVEARRRLDILSSPDAARMIQEAQKELEGNQQQNIDPVNVNDQIISAFGASDMFGPTFDQSQTYKSMFRYGMVERLTNGVEAGQARQAAVDQAAKEMRQRYVSVPVDFSFVNDHRLVDAGLLNIGTQNEVDDQAMGRFVDAMTALDDAGVGEIMPHNAMRVGDRVYVPKVVEGEPTAFAIWHPGRTEFLGVATEGKDKDLFNLLSTRLTMGDPQSLMPMSNLRYRNEYGDVSAQRHGSLKSIRARAALDFQFSNGRPPDPSDEDDLTEWIQRTETMARSLGWQTIYEPPQQ